MMPRRLLASCSRNTPTARRCAFPTRCFPRSPATKSCAVPWRPSSAPRCSIPRSWLADARRIAVLEDVGNYANIGSAFRAAHAFGIDAVLVTPSCHDPLFRRASRTSQGTVLQVPWTRIGTAAPMAAEGVPLLHAAGFKVAALALEDRSLALGDPRLAKCERLAMVLGTEGAGLFPSTIAACDYTVKIPMAHGVDSLNVAAASAVAFWELRAR